MLDTALAPHTVDIQWTASKPELDLASALTWTPRIVFFISSVDDTTVGASGFVVNAQPGAQPRLLQLASPFGTTMIDFAALNAPIPSPSESDLDDESTIMGDEPSREDFNLAAELESLSLLEAHADVLNGQIAARKKAIAMQMRDQRQVLCLKHLLRECDGLLCKAKAVAQRICDKMGLPIEPDYGYAAMKNKHLQHMSALSEKEGYTKIPHGAGNISEAQHLQMMLNNNGTYYGHGAIDTLNPSSPLLKALYIIAGALGLSALFAFIKHRCMSMRKRVERAADLEERQNARAYRKAARRAAMRKRWNAFTRAINCFGTRPEPTAQNYEEKRSLILQDAFLEQDLDQAEKGEVMEAEIRELRYAHEIVSSMVRVGDNRYGLATPFHDPPPCLVPLPSRSRGSTRASLHTLPSYTSESLPDYTSQPNCDTCSSSSSVVNDGAHSTTDGDERRTDTSATSENGSRRSRYTPTSSVLNMSPRPSAETLRTRQSKDTRDGA